MKLSQLEKNAQAFFQSGFNCAESVSQAVLEAFSGEIPQDFPRVASAFGGGIGGSHEDACGTLTGGILAIGYLLGRDSANANLQTAKDVAGRYREQFYQTYGTTQCSTLLDKFGDQVDDHECKKMVGRMAVTLAKILKDAGLRMKK